MHNDFQPYLKVDGSGIDYSQLEDYDTRGVMEKRLGRLHPLWERRILSGIELKDGNALRNAVDTAMKFGLEKRNPELMKQALQVLKKLSVA